MIAGIISGGAVGAAWIIGFIIYFIKRHKRERRAIAAGYRGHREMLDPPKKKEVFVIPPDPAIVEGALSPGDRAVDYPLANDSFTAKEALNFPPGQERRLGDLSEKTTPSDTPIVGSPNLSSSLSTPTPNNSRPSHPHIHSTTTVPAHYPRHVYPPHA